MNVGAASPSAPLAPALTAAGLSEAPNVEPALDVAGCAAGPNVGRDRGGVVLEELAEAPKRNPLGTAGDDDGADDGAAASPADVDGAAADACGGAAVAAIGGAPDAVGEEPKRNPLGRTGDVA